LPEDARLRNSADFRAVYTKGRRFDSRFMTVFVLISAFKCHRLGITASRKMSRRAVDRNRAKRLLREAFHQNRAELGTLKDKYDWVINARRSLIDSKSDVVTEDLKRTIAQVLRDEYGQFTVTEPARK
jgi:ribonuclease P protein component